MTDATCDPLTDETTPAPDEGPDYVVTPTLRAFGELVGRVEHLEADAPAHPADDADEDDEELLTQQRLTRHRSEIEEIKRVLNGVIEYLAVPGAAIPTPIPPAPAAAAATPATTPGAPA